MRLYKIKKSKIDKNGLYANCDIKRGTKIIEYKGKIISVKKVQKILNLTIIKQFIYSILINVSILMEILNITLRD